MERDLYNEAIVQGVKAWRDQAGDTDTILTDTMLTAGPDGPAYWIARHAARQTATVLLEVASNIGVTQEQWEALRVAAAKMAYD